MTQSIEEQIKVLAEWIAGGKNRRIEMMDLGGVWHPWLSCNQSLAGQLSIFSNTPIRLAPEPTCTPWTMEDVRPGMVFREKPYKDHWLSILAADGRGVMLQENKGFYALGYLMAAHEFSLDARTWHPCTKEGLKEAGL